MRLTHFVFIWLFSIQIGFAQLSEQDNTLYSSFEDSLNKIQQRVFFSKKESNRFSANKDFLNYWNQVLSDEKSFLYPFDSLKEISRLVSPDKKFRIITWNINKEDGSHAFFGFIQLNHSKVIKKSLFKKSIQTEYKYYQLTDKSGAVKTPENYIGDPTKWFGMLYYEIIQSDDDYYTLLAWDGNDKLTQRKFIDILYFKEDGTPVFGKDVFSYPGKFAKRIMFEYASEVSMSLKYNKNRKQLIFSHLAPKVPDATLENQFQYYGPDGSFDALNIKKGKWIYEPAIDIRKEKDKNDDVKKPDPNKQKPIYKP
jgi:hypothetical protein